MQFVDAFDFNKQTSLYIHVPFCFSKCSYCAFYSKPCNKDEIEQYFNKISKELDFITSKMNGKPFYTAYIGGGNPGCLSIPMLEDIASKICKNGRPNEFTIEMNPESITEKHFFLFEKYFTRMSVGVQSLDSKALSFLGRNASTDNTLAGIKLGQKLRNQTGAQISFDLITCLPSWHDPLSDVKKMVENYKPDHLSVYALTLEEGTPLFNAKPELPNSDKQYEILSHIWSYLELSGYKQYEVSNFAMDGKISLHNSVYWDYQQYVGLGPAAASTGFVNDHAIRVESLCDIRKYNESDIFESYNFSDLSKEETLEEFVLMGMRHSRGLNLSRLESEFGKKVVAIPKGYSIIDNWLCPDKNGLMTADFAASFILSNCIDS